MSTMTYLALGMAVFCAVAMFVMLTDRKPISTIVATVQAAVGQSDEARLAAISGSGSSSDGLHTLYQTVKLNNKDVEIMRRDRRRAMAAYPDTDPEQLFDSRWFAFDPAARVPSEGFGNSHGAQDPVTKQWYLESAYASVVRPEFPNRASDEATELFFAERKAKQDADRKVELEQDGPSVWWFGSGGSMSVHLNKKSGKVVIKRAEEWASTAKQWTMPFVVEEWVGINASDLAAIKKLPSFAQAVEKEISVTASGVSVGPVTSSGRAFDGVIMPGESVEVTTNLRVK